MLYLWYLLWYRTKGSSGPIQASILLESDFINPKSLINIVCMRVNDRFDVDPDPAFHFDADQIPEPDPKAN
jgi:hypothetical protein